MQRTGFNICIGPDAVLLRDHINRELAASPPPSGSAGDAGTADWERNVFWGEDPLPADFWEKLTLQGLFARPRAIILRQAQNLAADTLKKLSAALARGSEQIWPFVCFEVPFEKGKPKLPAHIAKLKFYEFAARQGWIKTIPALDQKGVRAFTLQEAARLGLRFAPGELELLAPALPPDAGAIRLELDKLALAAQDGRLPPDALDLLNFEPEMDVFAFLQALQGARRPEEVWARHLKDSGNASDAGLFGFLWALLREGRLMWQILAGEPVFLPGHVAAGKSALARSLGYGGLARIWDAALAADKGVKTGERSPHQAFEILIADLFRLFKRRARP